MQFFWPIEDLTNAKMMMVISTMQRFQNTNNGGSGKKKKTTAATNSHENTSSSPPSTVAPTTHHSSSYLLRYASGIFVLITLSCWFLLETSKWFSSSTSSGTGTTSTAFSSSSSSSSSYFTFSLKQQQHVRTKSSAFGEIVHQNHDDDYTDDDAITPISITLPTMDKEKEEEENTRNNISNAAAAAAASTNSNSIASVPEEQDRYRSLNLAPLSILRQYQKWHSVQALQNEWPDNDGTAVEYNSSSNGRKFAVALYWCPDRAGNVLMSLFNTITWAMITNRTLLFAWDESNPPQNNETFCNTEIWQRQAWLPLYRDWKHILPRDNEGTGRTLPPVSLSLDTTRRAYDELLPLVYFPMIPDVLFLDNDNNDGNNNNHDHNSNDTRSDSSSSAATYSTRKNPSRRDKYKGMDSYPTSGVVYRNQWNDHPLQLFRYKQYLSDLPRPYQLIMARLFAEGVEFWYGLLMEEFFTLFPLEQQQQQPTQTQHSAAVVTNAADAYAHKIDDGDNDVMLSDDTTTTTTTTTTSTFLVVLHSRHIAPADDGRFVHYEMDCLEQVLDQHYSLATTQNTTTTSSSSSSSNLVECRIVVMSDRPQTVLLIRQRLQEHAIYRHACTVLTTLDDYDGNGNNNNNNQNETPGPVAEVRVHVHRSQLLSGRGNGQMRAE
jgi:hypothetical protein